VDVVLVFGCDIVPSIADHGWSGVGCELANGAFVSALDSFSTS
jgi:hypothetical protein